MIYQNVEFNNCAELRKGDGYVSPQRVPEDVRSKLNDGAQLRVRQPASSEIRFVLPPGNTARVTLSSDVQSSVVVYFGDYRHTGLIDFREDPQTIEIGWNERLLNRLDAVRELPHSFDPAVVRILMAECAVRFHGAEGDGIRPPVASELPSLRYMTYGTSITHGAAALAPHLSYASRTARLIGADLLNFGLGGSCHCEPELADYLAGREDWDIATLALSVNMMGGFTREAFEERVRYLVHTIAAGNPDRPVACITLFPYFGEISSEAPHCTGKVMDFRQVLRDTVHDAPTSNLHLIEGPELLSDFTGLTTDLLHPSDDGMIQMGANLAERLKVILQ